MTRLAKNFKRYCLRQPGCRDHAERDGRLVALRPRLSTGLLFSEIDKPNYICGLQIFTFHFSNIGLQDCNAMNARLLDVQADHAAGQTKHRHCPAVLSICATLVF